MSPADHAPHAAATHSAAQASAPASAATLAGAANEKSEGRFDDRSQQDSTTPLESRQAGRIEALLQRGEANATSTRLLVTLTGMRSARELQAQIEAERNAGALILSRGGCGGGYFLPAEGEEGRREIADFIRTD